MTPWKKKKKKVFHLWRQTTTFLKGQGYLIVVVKIRLCIPAMIQCLENKQIGFDPNKGFILRVNIFKRVPV